MVILVCFQESKMKLINLSLAAVNKHILYVFAILSLAGCNSGQTNAKSDAPFNLSKSKNFSPLSMSLGGAIIGEDMAKDPTFLSAQDADEPFQKLPELELGYGFDPKTETIKVPQGYDASRLLEVSLSPNLEPSSIIIDEGSEYTDFAKYSGGSDSSSTQNKMEWKAGVGMNYGLYSASLKAGYAAQEDTANSSLMIKKNAGIVNQRRQHLLIDGKSTYTTTPTRTASIGNALMGGVGGLRFYIEAIRLQTDPVVRQRAIQRFYNEMGTHVISSVTRAYVGYHKVSLTHKMDSGQSSTTKGGEFALSSPFANGSASYSDTSAKAFKKTEWDFNSRTKTVPANATLLASLNSVYDAMDKEMLNYETVIDIGNLNQAIDQSKLPVLDFSSMKVEKSTDEIDKINQQKSLGKQMAEELLSLGRITAMIKAKITERDLAKDNPAKEKELNQEIEQAAVADSAPLILSLTKFMPGNAFGELNLVLEQRKTLTAARILQETLALNKVASLASIQLAEQKLAAADIQAQEAHQKAQEQATASVFSAWLKNVKYVEVNPMLVSKKMEFSAWFKTLTSSTIICYHREWDAYVRALGLTEFNPDGEKKNNFSLTLSTPALKVVDSRSNGAKQLKSAMLANKSRLLNEDEMGKPVVVDFNIVPWSAIFPELLETSVDDLPMAIQAKMIQEINEVLEDRSYLRLVSQLDQLSSELNSLYFSDKDMEGALLNLLAGLKVAQYDTNIVRYNGKAYNLATSEGVGGITAVLDGVRQSSNMLKSNWYKTVLSLKNNGLLSPLGMLMATGKESKTKLSIYAETEFYGNQKPQDPIYTVSNDNSSNSSSKNAGQQLARNLLNKAKAEITKDGIVVKTFIPLVFSGNRTGNQLSFMSSSKIVINGADMSAVPFPLTLGESHNWENNSTDVSYAINRAPGKMDALNTSHQVINTLYLTPSKYLLRYADNNLWTIFSAGDNQVCAYCKVGYQFSNDADLFYATRLNQNVFYSMSTQLSDSQLKYFSPRFTIFYGGQGNNATTKFIDSVF